jgi:hypothetical protein
MAHAANFLMRCHLSEPLEKKGTELVRLLGEVERMLLLLLLLLLRLRLLPWRSLPHPVRLVVIVYGLGIKKLLKKRQLLSKGK